MADERIEYQVEERTQKTIVRLSGTLALTSVDGVKKPFMDLLEKDDKELVFDLSGLVHIDSSGIALLIQLHRKAMAAAKTLSLSGLQDQVLRIFQNAGLDKMLTIVENGDV